MKLALLYIAVNEHTTCTSWPIYACVYARKHTHTHKHTHAHTHAHIIFNVTKCKGLFGINSAYISIRCTCG